MVEREANIDIVFRNGLKDYEALPPPEVWDNVYPQIQKSRNTYRFARYAALVIVLLTLSFFSYRISREIATLPENNIMAFDINSSPPVSNQYVASNQRIVKEEKYLAKTSEEATADDKDKIAISHPDTPVNTQTYYARDPVSLSAGNNRQLQRKPFEASSPASFNPYQTIVADYQLYPAELPVNKTEKWSIAALASPTYYSSINSGNDELYKQMTASEQPLVSYTGGIALAYKVNRRFSIQSGLYYSSVGQMVEGINSYGGFREYDYTKGDRNFEVLTSTGTLYTNNADVFIESVDGNRVITSYTRDVFDPKKSDLEYINNTLRQSLSYLEVPIILRYKIVDKTLDFNLIGGVSYNMLLDNSVYTIVEGGKYPIGATDGLNFLTISSSLGMGMEYNLSKKFSLNLEPTFRYYLNPFNTSGYSSHPYSFGVFSGVSYKF